MADVVPGRMPSTLPSATPLPHGSESRKLLSFPASACTTPCHSEVSCNLKEREKLLLHLPAAAGPRAMVSMSAPASPRGKLSGLGKSFGVKVTLRDTFLQFEPERVITEEGTSHPAVLRRRNSDPDVAGLRASTNYNKQRSMTVTLAQVDTLRERSKQLPSFYALDTVFDGDIIDDLIPSQDNNAPPRGDDDDVLLPSGMVDLARIDDIIQEEKEEEITSVKDDDDEVTKTTVMIRHLPRNLSQQDIINNILAPHGFLPGQVIDFFYAPINFKTLQNAGYCFVNFRDPQQAKECFTKLNNSSGMADTVSWARVQGCEANRNHYKSSPIMKMIGIYKPKWFSIDGNEVTLSSNGFDDDANQLPSNVVEGLLPVRRKSFNVNNGTDLYIGVNEVNRLASNINTSSSPHKLFIGGLDSQTDSEDLRRYFSQFGEVIECVVKKVEGTGVSRGFGFCSFSSYQGYTNCLLYQSYHQMNGRSISVQPYSRRRAKRC